MFREMEGLETHWKVVYSHLVTVLCFTIVFSPIEHSSACILLPNSLTASLSTSFHSSSHCRLVSIFIPTACDNPPFLTECFPDSLNDSSCFPCYIISKKHLRPGGMAPSEWMRSVRAVRDTPVADYSAPGVNTTRHVAYRPPIAVSPFLLALSVCYFKQTVWRCGQLWPYVGMGSLGTRLHRDCNAIGDAAKISPRVPSTLSSRSVGRRWEDMILPGCEDPRNCVDPPTERVRPKGGKDRVCIFVVWQDEMKMRCCLSTPGSPKYILRVAHSTSVTPVSPYTHHRSFHVRISVHPPSLLNDILGVRDRSSLEMHWEAVIERVWRCTWRPRWSELRDALGGRDRSSLEMHWEAEIEWTQRCTWRPWSSEFGDAQGGRDGVNSELHLEAVINRVWRCTGRLWPSEFGDALAGYDRARLEEYLEAVDLEGGAMAAETLFIG